MIEEKRETPEPTALRWWTLIPFLGFCVAAIAVGQTFSPGEWYDSLRRPAIAPPNWIFGVVWTPLYVMIAIAGWLLWERARWSWAMRLWFVQLALNAAWSWLFFGLHRPDVAFVEIVILWIVIGATVVLSWEKVRAAAWLLIPYWLWVGFASALNFEFWRLNA